MTWQVRHFRQRRELTARTASGWMLGLLVAGGGLVSWGADGRDRPRQRATPPATSWDKGTAGTFFDDAFGVLQGPRPAFAAPAASGGSAATAPAPAGLSEPASPGGYAWSALVSEETLTDEIKDMKGLVTAAAAQPSDFKGGGYEKARAAFSSLALSFGVIAAYDQTIRWKKDAATARDLFARVGFNCKVGTDQSFKETTARIADLETLLDGGTPQAPADRDEDFRWDQVAARPALMTRLEDAETAISAGLASSADFGRDLDRILHDAEMVAVIGEAIQQPNFEYHDDDTYRGHAAAMRDAAVRIRDACRKKDYDTARAAASELKKSCDACHGDYRS